MQQEESSLAVGNGHEEGMHLKIPQKSFCPQLKCMRTTTTLSLSIARNRDCLYCECAGSTNYDQCVGDKELTDKILLKC